MAIMERVAVCDMADPRAVTTRIIKQNVINMYPLGKSSTKLKVNISVRLIRLISADIIIYTHM